MPRRRLPYGRRLRKVEKFFFLCASLFFYWSVAAHLKLISRDGGVSVLDRSVRKDTIFGSLLVNDGDKHHHDTIPTNPLHEVYVIKDPLAGKIAVSDWNILSNSWDSNSSYADLLKFTKTVDVLPSMMPGLHSDGRVIFIIHSHPKMASTTLRRACWENLRSTCDVITQKRDPVGYSNAKDLRALIEKCENTHHFCVMGWHFGRNDFPNVTASSSSQPATFIHLFPYRNFDDWAQSAMKQVFVGHSDSGCNTLSERLNRCDGWLELDFMKYSKKAIPEMLGIMTSKEQQLPAHYVVLYDFSKVHTTLSLLCRSYHIPMLQHLDLQHKQTRQDGSCPMETLTKFHDCFDEQLLQL